MRVDAGHAVGLDSAEPVLTPAGGAALVQEALARVEALAAENASLSGPKEGPQAQQHKNQGKQGEDSKTLFACITSMPWIFCV